MNFSSIHENLIQSIGNTPLIRLRRASEETGCTLLGKAEFMNPGGSVKDRAALGILLAAEAGGDLKPGYQTEYEQWDANITYELTDGLVVFVEGINITNETFRSHGRSQYQTYGVGQIGARYNVGFRYNY